MKSNVATLIALIMTNVEIVESAKYRSEMLCRHTSGKSTTSTIFIYIVFATGFILEQGMWREIFSSGTGSKNTKGNRNNSTMVQ